MRRITLHVVGFARKVALELINFFCNNAIILSLLKPLKMFDAVFIMYPADQAFADYYTFRFRQRFIKWSPFIIGMIRHPSGKRTLKCAISAHIDGKDCAYEPEELRKLHEETECMRVGIGAKTTHFAGTIPGRLTLLKVRRDTNQGNEQRATVENVVRAVQSLVSIKNIETVIVLGCKGFVGRGVAEALFKRGVPVVGVDVDGVYKEGKKIADVYTLPKESHLLLNITQPEKVNSYIDEQMGGNTVFLNEVYPAPHKDVVDLMKERGVTPYHIAGVQAHVFPSFPKEYSGAIPCCAALVGENYEVVIKSL